MIWLILTVVLLIGFVLGFVTTIIVTTLPPEGDCPIYFVHQCPKCGHEFDIPLPASRKSPADLASGKQC